MTEYEDGYMSGHASDVSEELDFGFSIYNQKPTRPVDEDNLTNNIENNLISLKEFSRRIKINNAIDFNIITEDIFPLVIINEGSTDIDDIILQSRANEKPTKNIDSDEDIFINDDFETNHTISHTEELLNDVEESIIDADPHSEESIIDDEEPTINDEESMIDAEEPINEIEDSINDTEQDIEIQLNNSDFCSHPELLENSNIDDSFIDGEYNFDPEVVVSSLPASPIAAESSFEHEPTTPPPLDTSQPTQDEEDHVDNALPPQEEEKDSPSKKSPTSTRRRRKKCTKKSQKKNDTDGEVQKNEKVHPLTPHVFGEDGKMRYIEALLLSKGGEDFTKYYVKWTKKTILESSWVEQSRIVCGKYMMEHFEKNVKHKIKDEYKDGTVPNMICSKILSSRIRRTKDKSIMYLVKWKHFPTPTWETARILPAKAIEDYERHVPSLRTLQQEKKNVKIVSHVKNANELSKLKISIDNIEFEHFYELEDVRYLFPQALIDYLLSGAEYR
ncbi:hypothetical protein AKO1_009550 [Acrasis kona]|uniref:Chromo domain-containing protein n=1 Tax=Acrasis kona TaxID=1008807 RepID=A0AAW2ZM54_9EUKA